MKKRYKTKYRNRFIEKVHPRDYSTVGITALFHKFVSTDGKKVFGRFFKEIVSVVKDGQYYHGEIMGDREEVSKAFLKRVNSGEIDLNKIYKKFEKDIKKYEKLIRTPQREIELETVKVFFDYYTNLLDVAYLALDAIDVVEALDASKRKKFERWALKARKRAERIYKDGEAIFMPKYLKTLSKSPSQKYKPELLANLVFKELLDFIDKEKKLPSASELKRRQGWFYVSQYPVGKYKIASGQKAKQIIEKRELFGKDLGNNISELKGQAAYAGKVRGRVSVILSRKELRKFKKGDIIVSSMTDPSYLPIMKQSPAFVTDEGGILSHAAIVARELKKPCVIATKHATQVFKDGDKVEVDADKGIVRRLFE